MVEITCISYAWGFGVIDYYHKKLAEDALQDAELNIHRNRHDIVSVSPTLVVLGSGLGRHAIRGVCQPWRVYLVRTFFEGTEEEMRPIVELARRAQRDGVGSPAREKSVIV